MDSPDPIARQRAYYRRNAAAYDAGWSKVKMHLMLPFALLAGIVDVVGAESLLDVGSGSGRGMRTMRQLRPHLRMIGIEPSEDLRGMGHAAGIPPEELVDGDATTLSYADNAFDLVCEFGVLHHLPDPAQAIREMCRVAGKAVLIVDVNNFGEGPPRSRLMKQALNGLGLWKLADLAKTRGKGYRFSEGDGISYSYSVFNNIDLLEQLCRTVHAFNVDGSARDPYRTSPHVALLGLMTDEVKGLGVQI